MIDFNTLPLPPCRPSEHKRFRMINGKMEFAITGHGWIELNRRFSDAEFWQDVLNDACVHGEAAWRREAENIFVCSEESSTRQKEIFKKAYAWRAAGETVRKEQRK